jgi:hypothetical protein
MPKHATVRGTVVYRMGDGPACRVPRGPIEVELSPCDVTLSWHQDDRPQYAAVPRADFSHWLACRAIVMLH